MWESRVFHGGKIRPTAAFAFLLRMPLPVAGPFIANVLPLSDADRERDRRRSRLVGGRSLAFSDRKPYREPTPAMEAACSKWLQNHYLGRFKEVSATIMLCMAASRILFGMSERPRVS